MATYLRPFTEVFFLQFLHLCDQQRQEERKKTPPPQKKKRKKKKKKNELGCGVNFNISITKWTAIPLGKCSGIRSGDESSFLVVNFEIICFTLHHLARLGLWDIERWAKREKQ